MYLMQFRASDGANIKSVSLIFLRVKQPDYTGCFRNDAKY